MNHTCQIQEKFIIKKTNRKVALIVGQKRIAFLQEVRIPIDKGLWFSQTIPVSSEPNLYESQGEWIN